MRDAMGGGPGGARSVRRAMPSRTRPGESSADGTAEDYEVEECAGCGRVKCAMEMTGCSMKYDSKADGMTFDDMIERNGGDSVEVSVPMSSSWKWTTPIDIYRLRDRKFLLEEKKRLCAWALGTALVGIVLMMLHAELCPLAYRPGSGYALFINCSISLSTCCLLVLIVLFHYKDVRLFIIDHNQVDWRIAMTSPRVLGISTELVICAIHPVGTYWEARNPQAWEESEDNSSTSSAPLCVSSRHGGALLEMELLLSALMFMRLYLVHRTILLHSKVLLNASYRSVGSLNNISFTFRFVLKVMMNTNPGRTLLGLILGFWLISSWMLTLCERQVQAETGRLDTALWLIAITFLTVGYGDFSPSTSCGRFVCLFTGVMGVASTAMLVAVMTEKLALNKGEKHVHFFMMDIQVSKRVRHAAANVLRECWLLHRTQKTNGKSAVKRRHERRLLEAIRVFRKLRLQQRKVRDFASEMVDLPKMQMVLSSLRTNWENSYYELEQRTISMEQKLDELGRCFHQTSELLNRALHQRQPEIR